MLNIYMKKKKSLSFAEKITKIFARPINSNYIY